ncbi:MAG: inositol monophosphatase family protein [Candidatus Dasytiphilus stammeri]
MHPILNIAIRAIRKASNYLTQRYDKIDVFNQQNNFYILSNMLNISKQIIIDVIHQSYPEHVIYSKNINKSSDIQWIITPLDGVTNFVKKIPHFCMALAIRIKQKTEISVVYDLMRNELFTAVRGQGAQLNGYRLRSSSVVRNINSMIMGTEYSYKKSRQQTNAYFQLIKKMIVQCIEIRSTGSIMLDLAYVAAGRFDGYFLMGIFSIEDISAGLLLIREAGGLVADFNGGHNYVNKNNFIAASNPFHLKSLLKFLVEN